MEIKDFSKYKIGRASELSGSDRRLYRFFEMVPGILSWGTLVFSVLLSYWLPLYASIFIIAFDLYWFLKTLYLSFHLRHNWKRLKYNMALNWRRMLENLKHDHIYHMIVLPYYKEGREIIKKSLQAIVEADGNKKKMIVVLAVEERAGPEALAIARSVFAEYGKEFGHFLITVHPDGLSGEIAGKGSNISFASEEARKKILDANKIAYKNVIVSAFDIDTIVYRQYFNCLTWHFLTHPRPYNVSFQPVPLYNNNIWQSPAFSRVVAYSGTFWQMIQQERPERLATFSSHAISFKTLYEVGYWQRNIVSEDSRIYWNCFMAKAGDYDVVPLSYPISMDANLAPSFFVTLKNIYKQQRRWTWGVENVPYILYGFVKNKKIPLRKKLRLAFIQLEGFWSLATNPILIFLLGWLPVMIGGKVFNSTILSYNLPIITRDIMTITMLGLVFSVIITKSFLPKPPSPKYKIRNFFMILQWALIPISVTIFGAIPGLDSQTRLLLGRYMGFWVTPKHR